MSTAVTQAHSNNGNDSARTLVQQAGAAPEARVSEKLVSEVVRQTLAYLVPGSRDKPAFASTPPNNTEKGSMWHDESALAIFAELDRRNPDSADDAKSFLDRLIQNNAERAETEFYGESFAQLTLRSGIASTELAGPVVSAVSGDPIVRAFWWGFHIEFSHENIVAFVNSRNPMSEIIDVVSRVMNTRFPAWIGPVVGFMYAVLQVIAQAIDQGKGIYLSMSWFVPGVFIPTTVV
jgi:hypothetical protein